MSFDIIAIGRIKELNIIEKDLLKMSFIIISISLFQMSDRDLGAAI